MTSPTPTEIRRSLLLATYEEYDPEFDFSGLVADVLAAELEMVCYAVNWPATGEYRLWFAFPADLGLDSSFIAFSKAYTAGSLLWLDPDRGIRQTNAYPIIPSGLSGLFASENLFLATSYLLENYIIGTSSISGYQAYIDTSILDAPAAPSFMSLAGI